MKDFKFLLQNFFTHKDFLPPANELPGTMFTLLHFIVSAIILAVVIFFAIRIGKGKNEKKIKLLFTILWISMVVLEVVKITWETFSGSQVYFEATGILPLYPCSVFMYAMPFAIWGKGIVKKSAEGYICTIGLIGATINYFYPATILSNYSCISFAGFHTFFYHSSMLICALILLISKTHKYKVDKWYETFYASLPLLAVSIIANIVNFTINADYMFFKGRSFVFYDILGQNPIALNVILFYIAYLIIPALFYLPSLIKSKIKKD